jgi:hypothetical protein
MLNGAVSAVRPLHSLVGESGYALSKGAAVGFSNGLTPAVGAGGIEHIQPGRRDRSVKPAGGGLAKASSQASSRLATAAPTARAASVSHAGPPAAWFVKSSGIMLALSV